MRWTVIVGAVLLAAAALLAAGCGGGNEVGATPETVVGEVPTAPTTPAADVPALQLEGNATAGKGLFASNGCGSCHTLANAWATGTVGPALDETKPDFELAATRITEGKGGMPSFGDQLEPQQIADLAQYVADSAGG